MKSKFANKTRNKLNKFGNSYIDKIQRKKLRRNQKPKQGQNIINIVN